MASEATTTPQAPGSRDDAWSPVTEAPRKRMPQHDGVGRSPEDRRNGGVSTSSSKGKRKMGAISKDSSPTLADGPSRRPPAKKPMHEHDAMTWRNNHLERRTPRYDDGEASGSRSMECHHHDGDLKFRANQVVSDALLAALAELGASAPLFVDRKQLTSTDVRVDQNRLQISSRSPISRAFTDAESVGVRTGTGIPVTALDRRGEAYVLVCKLFRAKNYYRLRGPGWREFLEKNSLGIGSDEHLRRQVTVELWTFRSRALLQPKGESSGGGGEGSGSGHPDGELGLVVLHRDEVEGGEQELVEGAPVAPEEEAELENAVQEEAAADAFAEQGEAGARAASYETKRLQVAAAVLWVLPTSDRIRRKQDYAAVGKGDASVKRLRFKSAVPRDAARMGKRNIDPRLGTELRENMYSHV